MIDYKLIGARIKAAREKCRITQEALAEQADITAVYLSKIENGKVHPTLEVLATLCAILKCDPGELLGNTLPESADYRTDQITQLFSSLSPSVKPIAVDLLQKLSEIK